MRWYGRKIPPCAFSLDRTDLWDLRPADSLSGNNYRFAWVKEHIRKGDYQPVQKKFDEPYDRMPVLPKYQERLWSFRWRNLESLYKYVCIWIMLVWSYLGKWYSNANICSCYRTGGWFVLKIWLRSWSLCWWLLDIGKREQCWSKSGFGTGFATTGIWAGKCNCKDNELVYHQKGYGDFSYDVVVKWERQGNTLYGTWSITSSLSGEQAEEETSTAMLRGL